MSEPIVKAGATVICTMGTIPTTLLIPFSTVHTLHMPIATIEDYNLTNIITFGICNSPANPAFKPPIIPPCVPILESWSPGSSTVKIKGCPVLNFSSKCQCQYGGTISIISAGQFQVNC